MIFPFIEAKKAKARSWTSRMPALMRRISRTILGILAIACLSIVIAYASHPYPSKIKGFQLWPAWLPIFWPDDYQQDDATVLWNPPCAPWTADPNGEASREYLAKLKPGSTLAETIDDAEYDVRQWYILHDNRYPPKDWPNNSKFWDIWKGLPELPAFIQEGTSHEVFWQDYGENNDIYLHQILNLDSVYQAYLLELARKNPISFEHRATEYFNWLLKGKRGAQTIQQNLVWNLAIDGFCRTVATCIREMNISQDAMRKLYTALPPLSIQELGLRRGFEVEYLQTANFFSGKNAFAQLIAEWPEYDPLAPTILFHPNETLNLLGKHYQKMIEFGEAGDIEGMQNTTSNLLPEPRSNPPLKNHLGNSLLQINFIAQPTLWEGLWETTIRYQLLRKELASRAGIEVDIRDPLTEKPFLRDDQGFPYSVGIDRIPDTEDDIHLSTLSE